MAIRIHKTTKTEIWLNYALLIGYEHGPPHSIWLGPIEIAIWPSLDNKTKP